MRHIIVEGLPATGKSEILEVLARFYPESVRVLPEMVKEVVLQNGIDLFRERNRLTDALLEALPRRRQAVAEILDAGKLCVEESHLGVHYAYAQALGDTGFIQAFEEIRAGLPRPDAYIRLDVPVAASLARQAARGTPAFDITEETLKRFLAELDRFHAMAGHQVHKISAHRPAADTIADVERFLGLTYAAPSGLLDSTFDVILLLGRPASGKSEFIDFMTHAPDADRARDFHLAPFDVVDDFPILWEKFEEDDLWEGLGHGRRYSKRSDGNYAVTDDALWGFLIGMINRKASPAIARVALGRRTLIVEFSRGGATGYADALAGLSDEILSRAAILYVSVSFEESWRRNVARYDEKARDGILTHSVPREEMERTYGSDDWKALTEDVLSGFLTVQGHRIPFATMGNEPESTDPAVLRARYHDALAPLYDLWRGASPA